MSNSNASDLPAFSFINHLMVPLGALNSPAELHGMLCGRLSGGARLSDSEWLEAVVEFMDLADDMPSDTTQAMTQLYQISLAQLSDQGFALRLLLPEEDATAAVRAEALGQWCRGYLSGFGGARLRGDAPLPEDVTELLSDFVAIAQIHFDEEGTEAEVESNLLDLIEHVRLGALTIHLECGTAAAESPKLH